MKIVAIIQARLGSTRLPRKILADIEGQTMLDRVVARAIEIPGLDHVVVAMPYSDTSAMREYAGWTTRPSLVAISLFGWAGRDDDVLGRYDAAARGLDADVILRITSDCPLLDPVFSTEVLRRFLSAGALISFVSNEALNTDGFDTEVFSAWLLRLAAIEATSAEDREHVTPWMRRHAPWPQTTLQDGPTIKLSVDTLDDLERVRAIYRYMGKDVFSRTETLNACEALGAK